MAWLVRTNGMVEVVHPSNHQKFSLEELRELVGGYIAIVHFSYPDMRERPMLFKIEQANLVNVEVLITKNTQMVLDDEGGLKNKPVNKLGCLLYGTPIHGTPIVGTILLCEFGREI